MSRIVTVYINAPRLGDAQASAWVASDMSYIRWFKISEALEQRGHQVDIAVPDGTMDWPVDHIRSAHGQPRLIDLSTVSWRNYDVVKTLFNRGIETLEMYGGIGHPFIISKLGSIVGPEDMPGIHFYGDIRASMYEAQQKISRSSRYVTLLSQAAKELWIQCHGGHAQVLLVPGGADATIPAVGVCPFPNNGRQRCLFAGHIYDEHTQPEANATLCAKLNGLGKLLRRENLQLYMIGSGDTAALDERYVTFLGSVPYAQSWNYLQHADVGIVVSAGRFMHNNESSKIYHYLRAGLPIVSEDGFPNGRLIREADFGFEARSDDLPDMAEKIVLAANTRWDKEKAVQFILNQHTWFHRTQVYDEVIAGGAGRRWLEPRALGELSG